jgi:hypothetical protein
MLGEILSLRATQKRMTTLFQDDVARLTRRDGVQVPQSPQQAKTGLAGDPAHPRPLRKLGIAGFGKMSRGGNVFHVARVVKDF